MCHTPIAASVAANAEVNVLTRIPSLCLTSDARMCGMRQNWIQQCCAAIAMKDHLIFPDDLLDLSNNLWEVPGCHTTCPKLVVDSLFADDLASLADTLPVRRAGDLLARH